MDPRHKAILQQNRTNLVTKLNPTDVCDGLLARGIFTQDMIDEIQSSETRRAQARRLVKDLETRGSRAFSAFLECLRETDQARLAELLESGNPVPVLAPAPVQPPVVPLLVTGNPESNRDAENHDRADASQKLVPLKPTTLPLYEPPSPSPGSEMPRVPRQRHDSLQCYKMDASPSGISLIINNVQFDPDSNLKERKGSDIDCDKLEKRFKFLNFEVIVKKNLTCKQIRHELSLLAKKDHSMFDCCVVIILSHGTEATHNRFPGAVHGVDGSSVPIQIITNYLNGQNCPSLQGKPKLFFIQACGGDQRDVGFEVSPDEVQPIPGGIDDQMDSIPLSSSSDSLSLSDEVDARASLPTPSDILVSYSTFPGYVSWRDTYAGSWYVEILDRVLEQNSATDDLVTMLMMLGHINARQNARLVAAVKCLRGCAVAANVSTIGDQSWVSLQPHELPPVRAAMSSYNVKLRRVAVADYDTQIKEVRNQLAEQQRVFDCHLEQNSQVLQDLSDYLRRRGEIEGEYARSLDKLADKFTSRIKKKEYSSQSVVLCWQELLSQTRQESKDHSSLSDSCGSALPQQLSRCLEHVQRLAKKSREIGSQLQEELLKVTSEMQTTLKTYSQYHAEYLSAECKLREAAKQEEKQKQSAAKKIERLIEKRQCKVQETELKCTKARNDYLLNLEAANASMNKYYLHDLSAIIDSSVLGFHQSLSQVLQIYLSRRQQAHQNLGCGLQQLVSAQSGLDQSHDRDALMQAHETTFCLPLRFHYQPHEGDQVCEVCADYEMKSELETRFNQLQTRLSSNESEEVSKALEVARSALVDCITEDIFGPAPELTASQSMENISETSTNKINQAKRRSNLQDTEDYYFTEAKERLIKGLIMSKQEAKYNLLKVAIQKAETVDSRHHRMRSKRSVRQRKNQSTAQISQKPFSGDMLSYIQASKQPIPLVVESCIRFINLNGLHHEGIFRVPGSQLEVNRLRDTFENGDDPLADEVCDMDTVACVLKLYFRGMENPLFPKDSYEQLMECGRTDDEAEKAAQLKTVILSYPPPLIVVMRYLFAFLNHVSQYSDENMMQPYNLAVCFGPSLIRGPEDADAATLQQINALVKTIIIRQESIFPSQSELEGPVYEMCMTLEQEDIEPAGEEAEVEADASPNKEVSIGCTELEGVALFDYTARSSAELSFKQGVRLTLHSRASSDWWRGEFNGTKGLIPDKYISVSSVEVGQNHKEAERTSSGGSQTEDQPTGTTQARLKVFNEKSGSVAGPTHGGKITLQIPKGQPLWPSTSPGALRKSLDPQKRRSAPDSENTEDYKIQVDKEVCRQMNSVFKELASRQEQSSTEASSLSASPPQNSQRRGSATQKVKRF
ncbi:hypothetical protein NFI96_017459 [Prochilodus magdalenae]|nr:hypothetical protein NFI96_017459 [Prochilodus magdalenae]